MTQHSFKVSQSEDAPSHDVKVSLPSYKEATEKQRENAWDEALRAIRIKVQGTLRRRIGKGVRGEALNKEAQAAFDAILNGTRAAATPVTRVPKGLKLTDAQKKTLREENPGTVFIFEDDEK